MEKMIRVNLLVPPRLWSALAKAAAESGHPRASFVRMVLQQACEKGAAPVPSQPAAPFKPAATNVWTPPKAKPGSELSTQEDARDKYESFLREGDWIEDALAKTDAIWAKNGLAYSWCTTALPGDWEDLYRERAAGVGRDAEADVLLHNRAIHRI